MSERRFKRSAVSVAQAAHSPSNRRCAVFSFACRQKPSWFDTGIGWSRGVPLDSLKDLADVIWPSIASRYTDDGRKEKKKEKGVTR